MSERLGVEFELSFASPLEGEADFPASAALRENRWGVPPTRVAALRDLPLKGGGKRGFDA